MTIKDLECLIASGFIDYYSYDEYIAIEKEHKRAEQAKQLDIAELERMFNL